MEREVIMMRQQYPNHFIQSLSQAQKRRGDTHVRPSGDRRDGFIETLLSEEEPQEQPQVTAPEVCSLSRRQLQDLGAVTAEVVEIREGSHFIKLAYHIGNQKRTAEAFCTYADSLQTGDRLYVLVRERGRQQTIILLGLIPDQKRG